MSRHIVDFRAGSRKGAAIGEAEDLSVSDKTLDVDKGTVRRRLYSVSVGSKTVWQTRGRFSSVEVLDVGAYRCLRIGDDTQLTQGYMHRRNPLDFRSEYLRQQIAASVGVEAPLRALCLGLGVGAVPRLLRALYPQIAVDAVELEPAVVEAAKRHFGLQTNRHLQIHEADARQFVRRSDVDARYDLVFVDCYDSRAIPDALRRSDFYDDLVACVRPNGLLSANIVQGRLGALSVITHCQDRLHSPWAIAAPTKTNCAIFGGRTDPLLRQELLRRAQALDALRRLPFRLETEIRRAVPLNEFRPRRQRRR